MMPTENPAAGLYVHVPFCASRCSYCDFFSSTDTESIDAFVDALLCEAGTWTDAFRNFDTVYIGGGTPSLLSPKRLETVLDRVCHVFTLLPGTEITIEINPADWGREELTVARDLGINRISMGVQSFNDDELSFMGRRHRSKEALRAIEDAVAAGFGNLSIDLIYALPGQRYSQWQASLERALTFAPSHLSCYELEIKRGTPLGDRYHGGELPLLTEESRRDFFLRTSEFLEGAGYVHYEISNFARSMERASRHNQKYWDHTPYLGLGPSAHSYSNGKRWWNHASVTDYILDCGKGIRPVAQSETLDMDQLRLEALFLGLRTGKGIDLHRYRHRYGRDLLAEKGPLLAEFRRAGLIEMNGTVVRPTRAGMAVADSLALL